MNNEKTQDQIADELIAKHFPTGTNPRDFSLKIEGMLPHQQRSVRALVLEALATGSKLYVNLETGFGKIIPRNPKLAAEIATDALIYEQSLKPDANKTRIEDHVYPWGWRYEDSTVQNGFRRFCQTNIKG